MATKSKSKDIVLRPHSKEMVKLLQSCGVPLQDMPSRQVLIDLEESLVKITPDIPGVVTRSISVGKQLTLAYQMQEHPLKNAGVVGISSFPSDLRAKYLAIYYMSLAIEEYRKGNKKPGRGMPVWHRVYGGFTDQLRDKPPNEIPCMLVIANVNLTSTPQKIEKVRDLLERYSEIPRIIVTGGEPCCSLFAHKLFYPMRAGLYLGPDNREREV